MSTSCQNLAPKSCLLQVDWRRGLGGVGRRLGALKLGLQSCNLKSQNCRCLEAVDVVHWVLSKAVYCIMPAKTTKRSLKSACK